MSLLILWGTMVLLEWVEVRSRRSTSVSVVPKLVNVHSTLRVGIVAGDLIGDDGRRRLALLSEDDSSTHIGVSADNSD